MKTKLRLSWTEVIPRSTEIELELDENDFWDLRNGYGTSDRRWRTEVRKVEGEVEMLHDEVDYIEVLEEPEPCSWFVNNATTPAWCCNTHMYDGTGDFPATGEHPDECPFREEE